MFTLEKSKYDFVRLHLGTNSVCLTLLFIISIVISFYFDVLRWNYLKGFSNDLSFFIGLFSFVLGVGFYSYWRLGEKSVYTIHFAKNKFIPKDVNIIFDFKNFSFGISSQIKEKFAELPSILRAIICVGIFFNLALITLDNGKFDKLRKFPSEILESKSGFCSDEEVGVEVAPQQEGCELIIRAYKLGYAKNLGVCESKKADVEKLKICQKRRVDEPYLHYMSRLLTNSIENKMTFFENDRAKIIAEKFELQLNKLKILKEYQRYAISASPRASHHIWTDLPYPENIFISKYRELFQPNYCIGQFQNQTNTVRLQAEDERHDSKLLEHVYGQLLFNPKNSITVGFCKEYKIHWQSKPDICERLAKNPKAVLQEESVLDEVELVLKRHDIANAILSLDEDIQKIEQVVNEARKDKSGELKLLDEKKSDKKQKNINIKSKIAKAKQQIRDKNELVSFQCFMERNGSNNKNIESSFKYRDASFLVRTRYFTSIENNGESQIAMYREFSKVLENRFHYSQLKSRSDVNIVGETGDVSDAKRLLEQPAYLFSRLEVLKNVDIFLDNKWVLERDDLLEVYPYHVHLQNYVNSFRAEYRESRGRL